MIISEDDGYEIMFEKKVTLCVRNTSKDQWSTAGTGMLHILYCPKINSMSGQIRIIDDKDQAILSLTTIDANSSIEVIFSFFSLKEFVVNFNEARNIHYMVYANNFNFFIFFA